MQLRYGSFAFAVNACEVTSQTRVIRSETGRPIRYHVMIHALAYLDAAGQTACSFIENQLRAALLVPYQTLALLQDNGATSSLAIINNNSISGVVITDGPHFNTAMDAEFVTRRTAEFSGEAEFIIQNSQQAVIDFRETVSITGNSGPITSWRKAVNARPIFQIVYPYSTCRVTQSGRAVGHMAYPAPANLLFDQALLHQDRSRIIRESPRRIGPDGPFGGLVEYTVSWNYEFENDQPMFALPQIPPL